MSPNRTTPSISEIVAGSFGRRASNSSATRGRPPVMSRVLYASRGILVTVTPFFTLTAGDSHTVLSLLSFLLRLGHASLIGRSSTLNDFADHGLASAGISNARDTWSVGEPKMMRLPSASVYSCGSFRFGA